MSENEVIVFLLAVSSLATILGDVTARLSRKQNDVQRSLMCMTSVLFIFATDEHTARQLQH